MSSLLISGGRIIDPSQEIDLVGDLLIVDGKINCIGDHDTVAPKDDSIIINAKGMVVCPGFIDLHCHLREPGFEAKETIATGTRAAAKGGFTTVCCMPNTNPPIDSVTTLKYVRSIAVADGAVRVFPIGCITKGQNGEELVEMQKLAKIGAIAFSDDGKSVENSRLMRRALDNSFLYNLPIIQHSEITSISADGVMNEGQVAEKLGLKGIPAMAEEAMIERDVSLAKVTASRLHIAHVSTAASLEYIRRVKEVGFQITAEVTPHHLTLTEERVIDYGTNAKVNPPLRTEKDINALLDGLKSGVIDAIATDHAPHTIEDKNCDFNTAAFGISGLETALGVLLDLVHKEKLDLSTLISKLTIGPAKVLPLLQNFGTLRTGSPADITIFDPEREWEVNPDLFASKGKNTPWAGCSLKGKVMITIVNGEIVYKDNAM